MSLSIDKRFGHRGAISLLVALCLLAAVAAGAGAGGFGRDGKKILRLHGSTQRVVPYGQGRLLLLGRFFGEGAGIVRLRANGSIDRSFAARGFLAQPWADAVVRRDGKILVLSFSSAAGDPMLTRLLANGRRDRNFGGDGSVAVDLGGEFDTGKALALAPEGKIVVVGASASSLPEGRFGGRGGERGGESQAFPVVARLQPGGAPDRSFSRDGIFSLPPRTPISSLEVEPSGAILGFGARGLVRLREEGRLDASFGDRGVVSLRASEPAPGEEFFERAGAALLRDGRILVAGTVSRTVGQKLRYRAMVMRFKRNGRLDRSYGQDGYAKAGFRGFFFASSLMALRDGGVVVAGNAQVPAGSDSDLAALSFTSSGRLDRRFGRGGRVAFDFPGWSVSRAIAPGPRGRAILVGSSSGDKTTRLRSPLTVLARFPLR